MSSPIMLTLLLVACITLASAGGHGGGGHKKVVIHVPLYVKHHHHKHTIVKHVHHKHGGGGDDHYEVLGYTYGEPKAAPHGGGHGFGAADEGHDYDAPTSFDGGDHQGGYALSEDYGSNHYGY